MEENKPSLEEIEGTGMEELTIQPATPLRDLSEEFLKKAEGDFWKNAPLEQKKAFAITAIYFMFRKPPVVCRNNALEKKLLALSREGGDFIECSYLMARCPDGIFKQFHTSFSPDTIYYRDINKALKRLRQKVGGKWSNVTTFEFIHTHPEGPLSEGDIHSIEYMAERLYPKGVKNIIMTAAAESGYSFRYSPSPVDFCHMLLFSSPSICSRIYSKIGYPFHYLKDYIASALAHKRYFLTHDRHIRDKYKKLEEVK